MVFGIFLNAAGRDNASMYITSTFLNIDLDFFAISYLSFAKVSFLFTSILSLGLLFL